MSLKPIAKLTITKFDKDPHDYYPANDVLMDKINELIEVVNEQSEIINNLRMIIKIELVDRFKSSMKPQEINDHMDFIKSI